MAVILGEKPKFNKQCPAHNHFCWGHRHLMREDDLVCAKDYVRLPPEYKSLLWSIKYDRIEDVRIASSISMVVDWLLERPLPEDVECKEP